MYNNILIPVMFGEKPAPTRAFEAARALANDGAAFTLIHVVEDIPVYLVAEIPQLQMEATRKNAKEALTALAQKLPGATTLLVTGHAGRAILQHADYVGNDCIILESHQPGFEDFFLGSTASRVVRHAKCAVHVIR